MMVEKKGRGEFDNEESEQRDGQDDETILLV